MTSLRQDLTHSNHLCALHRTVMCLVAVIGGLATLSAQDPPYGLETRPAAAAYLGNMPSAPPIQNYTTEIAFPNLTFQGALAIRAVPGTNRLWVLEREGRIWSFENNPATTIKTLVLDLNDDDLDPTNDPLPPPGNPNSIPVNDGHLTNGVRWWCQGWDDCGLMGLAFHPEFGQPGSANRNYFYLSYQAKSIPPLTGGSPVFRPDSGAGANKTSNRLACFTAQSVQVGVETVQVALPDSELILMDQPDRHLWHNGGDLLFDHDGYLYMPNGDEGQSDDSLGNTQRVGLGLLSGVFRIDVDGPRPGISHAIINHPRKHNPADANETAPFSGNYGIPNDNPWVGLSDVLEEFWAVGLRSPHRMTYDQPSTDHPNGRIFLGDIGQGAREEVDVIVKGGNYQWAYKEGHKNNRSDRQPPDYTVNGTVPSTSINIPLTTTASVLNGAGVSPGQLSIGDRIRFTNHATLYRIESLTGYPHTAITISPALTATVPLGTALRRTTGFTMTTVISSSSGDEVPNNYGSSRLAVSGTGQLQVGQVIAFSGLGGSHEIINVVGLPATEITIRPGFTSSPAGTPAMGSAIDQLTVFGQEQPPLMDFSRGGTLGFSAIIGGYVYHGAIHPDLVGRYIFANNPNGALVALNPDLNPPTIVRLGTIANYDGGSSGYRGIGGFGVDQNGELLLCVMQTPNAATNAQSGRILRITRGTSNGTPIPVDLRDTGAFAIDEKGDPAYAGDNTVESMIPVAGLIPYNVNSPLWSDGAGKRRWISVPTGQQVHFTSAGQWSFPEGTVFVKHFDLTVNQQTKETRRLETRLLVRSPGSGVYGVTYRWNDTGTQALLVPEDGATSAPYPIIGADGNPAGTQTWNFPSRSDCLTCHNSNAGYVLGVSTRQLNGSCTYPPTNVSDNQLRTWAHIGLFDTPPAEPSIPALPNMVAVTNDSAPLEHRVRSWIDANCSHCHQPGGVHSNFDARFDTPLTMQGIVDGSVNVGLGISNPRVIAPRNLARSVMHLRDNSLDPAIKMPPLAKNLVDTKAMEVMAQWIMGLPSTDPVIPPTVAITAPTTGTIISTPGPLTISATAADADGTVTQVEFFRDGELIATDTSAPYEATLATLGVGTWVFTTRATDNVGATTLSIPVSVTVVGNTGLLATYWDNMDFTGPSVSRIDQVIDFDWALGSPAAGIDPDTFSVRWTGSITAPVSGTWTFTTTSDDGVRLWINGQPVINNWTNHSPTEDVGTITMTAGVPLPLVMEFFENGVTAIARLQWAGPGLTRSVVPFTAFTPQLPPTPPMVALTSPGNGSAMLAPATIVLSADASDLDSTVTMVEFLRDGQVIASDTTAPYSATISGLAAGTYAFTARATDAQALTSTSTAAIVTVSPPGTLIGLEATYYDNLDLSGPSLTRIDPTIDFNWGNGSPAPQIGADTFSVRWQGTVRTVPGAPAIYNFHTTSDDGVRLWINGIQIINNWTDHGPTIDTGSIQLNGDQNYPIIMEFFENGGGAVARLEWSGAAVPRTIIPIARLSPPSAFDPPTVVLTAPTNGTLSIAPATIALSADASDSDGTITLVEFLRDNVRFSSDTTAPYTATISGLAVGSYTFTARATDSQGLVSTSVGVSVTVIAAVPPSVSLTAPLAGAMTSAPGSFTLSANASDSDGTIAQVVFLQDGVIVATDTTAPYVATVNGLVAGAYSFTAQATDSQGLTATSTAIAVSVTNTTGTGQILREWWTGIGGTAVSDLTNNANFLGMPNGTALLTAFETPTDVMDNYGTRVRGYVIPPTTGPYVFWIAGDDNCQLFLGTTATPLARVPIASVPGWTTSREWGKFPTQQSAPMNLTAGVLYAIEALQKEGGGGDNLAVGWQLPDGTLERPIPGNRLKPYDPALFPAPQVTLTTPANDAQLVVPATVTLTASATDADGQVVAVEFLQNNVVVATVNAPPWTTTRSGLVVGNYTFAARATDHQGQQSTSPARIITVLNADGTGALRREWWSGITGTSINQLTNAPGYPGTPTGSDLRQLFEAPTDWADSYGTRMSGFVVAPLTGPYVFWIAGDDNCELWLSNNDSAAAKVLIARVPGWTNNREWTKSIEQQSAPITLTAGARYWIEALQKEGGGGDHLAVGWQLPGGTQERPIPGSRLMPPVMAVSALPIGWSVRLR